MRHVYIPLKKAIATMASVGVIGCGATTESTTSCIPREALTAEERGGEADLIRVRRDCPGTLGTVVARGSLPLSFRDFRTEFLQPRLSSRLRHVGTSPGCELRTSFQLSFDTPEEIDAAMTTVEAYLRRQNYEAEVGFRLSIPMCEDQHAPQK